jgi:heat shock protein beta
MLFLPSAVPWELSQDMFNEAVKPMKLYVRRVFISDKFTEELLPRWLRFLKGIVDSDDLPLNVSREILQKSRTLMIIRKRLIKKALAMIKGLRANEEEWNKFNTNFARYIKVGIIEDKDNKDEILQIATFQSSHSKDLTTMADYVSRMKDGQKQIYYITGTSRQVAMSSPALERLKKKGFEVLLALDQIDEVALQGVGAYEEYQVVDAAKENVDMDETEEEMEEKKKTQEDMKATCEFIQSVMGDSVDKVEVSNRLESSPSALVQPLYGMSPSMQKFMKSQAAEGAAGVAQKANLEINAKHAVIKKISSMVAADGDKPSDTAVNYAKLVYEMAALSSGWEISDPASFAKRIAALMEGGDAALEGFASDSGESEKNDDGDESGEKKDDGDDDDDDDDEVIEPEVITNISP